MPASDKNLFDSFAVLGIQTTTVRHCKTLFLKNKNGNHWLVVMLGNIRLDMKILQKNWVLHDYHSQN